MKSVKSNYDIFILQATLGKEIAPLIKDKIKLLDKYSAHVEFEKNMSKKELMFRNIKIPFSELFSASEFEHNKSWKNIKLLIKF